MRLVARALERAFGAEPEDGRPRPCARARIADYWMVSLIDRVLEVHREPARPGPALRHWAYAAIETLGPRPTITPLSAPSASIRVADLLP